MIERPTDFSQFPFFCSNWQSSHFVFGHSGRIDPPVNHIITIIMITCRNREDGSAATIAPRTATNWLPPLFTYHHALIESSSSGSPSADTDTNSVSVNEPIDAVNHDINVTVKVKHADLEDAAARRNSKLIAQNIIYLWHTGCATNTITRECIIRPKNYCCNLTWSELAANTTPTATDPGVLYS